MLAFTEPALMSQFQLPNFVNPTNIILVIVVVLLLFLVLILRKLIVLTSRKIDLLSKNLTDEMKFSIQPKFMEMSLNMESLIELAVEVWRIEQRLAKSMNSLPDNQKQGLESSVQKLKRYLEKYDIQIIDHVNQKYNEGLNLDVLSVEKDPSISAPVIKETKEPTIMCKGQVVRKAKIILLTN